MTGRGTALADETARCAPVVFCSKSPWRPALRREHSLARLAAAHGHGVAFVERPGDIRAARSDGVPGWLAALARPAPGVSDLPGVVAWRRSTVAPGHLSAAAEALEAALLHRCLNRVAGPGAVVIGGLPWQWPAIARTRARRRVFDCTDDWTALIPARAARIRELLVRVGAEADEVVVTSPDLAPLFGGRDVTVVPNGVDGSLVASLPAPLPGARRMAYVGTLSERFDAPLMGAVLDRLPGWHLSLYGESRYAGGGPPPPELRALLDRPDRSVNWHGVVERDGLAAVLDAADVLVVPNRPAVSRGQSSMKLYDYSARGRPVVATPGQTDGPAGMPPGMREAHDAVSFARAVEEVADEPAGTGLRRLHWVRRNTWDERWPAWSAAVIYGAGRAPGTVTP